MENLEISDYDIQALADGELDDEKRREIMKHIMRSPELLERLDELCRQNRQLREWWRACKLD
jgi:anti-sigma factor RsiW